MVSLRDGFFNRIGPKKILQNKLNVLNIATKSTNIGEILVYVAMFSKTIDKILCFAVPHEMKISNFFSL